MKKERTNSIPFFRSFRSAYRGQRPRCVPRCADFWPGRTRRHGRAKR